MKKDKTYIRYNPEHDFIMEATYYGKSYYACGFDGYTRIILKVGDPLFDESVYICDL